MDRIYVEQGAVNSIAARVGCSRTTVTNALQGRNKSSVLARKIRALARQEYRGQSTALTPLYGEAIVVPYGVSAGLCERFGVVPRTVRKALRGYSDTPLSREIRRVALEERGGYRIDADGKMIDTVHFEGDIMRQQFGNGVYLEADRRSGEVRLWHNGRILDSCVDTGIERLMQMQANGADYARKLGAMDENCDR